MYEIARNSTIRMVYDTIAEINQNTDMGIQYYEWDAHAEDAQLPDTDLAGLIGFSCAEEGSFHDVVAAVGIVVFRDPGIYRLTSLVDVFYRRLRREERYDLFNPDGTKCGVATCFDGVSVAPTSRVDVRPAQSVSFSARLLFGGV